MCYATKFAEAANIQKKEYEQAMVEKQAYLLPLLIKKLSKQVNKGSRKKGELINKSQQLAQNIDYCQAQQISAGLLFIPNWVKHNSSKLLLL